MLALAFWCFIGMVIDGWAHTHGEVDDSFLLRAWDLVFWFHSLCLVRDFRTGNYTMVTFQRVRLQLRDSRRHAKGYSVGSDGGVCNLRFGDMLAFILGIEGTEYTVPKSRFSCRIDPKSVGSNHGCMARS